MRAVMSPAGLAGSIGLRPIDRVELRRRPLALLLRRPSEKLVLSSMALATYMVLAAIILLDAHSIIGDAWSRVANAYYVLFSRDPHLAAIGFVWNPLPSLAVIPLLPLKAIWPDMVATGFAGAVVSALCMAGSVWQVHAIGEDWQVRRSARLAVTLLFAFNPMILYYAANGMSEAMFILTMLISVRYLARWARNGQVVPLTVAGVAMAAAYMTRYEAVVAAFGAFGAVIIISAARRHGEIRERIAEGFADGALFVAPFGTAFVAWALASWLIVGNPFQQFTSVYGVVSQLQVAQGAVAQVTGQGTSSAYWWIGHQMIGMEPGILVLGAFGLAATFKGRHGLTLPAVGILGSVVVFAIYGFLSGRTLGWLRYTIDIIPLASVLALAILAPNPTADLAATSLALETAVKGSSPADARKTEAKRAAAAVDGAAEEDRRSLDRRQGRGEDRRSDRLETAPLGPAPGRGPAQCRPDTGRAAAAVVDQSSHGHSRGRPCCAGRTDRRVRDAGPRSEPTVRR
jgi:hypothetical protein